jgi:tetratricopeptide (TPR) repeat protein
MMYRLLLVDGFGEAITAPLHISMLREFPGSDGVSVHFRPVRNDALFESARTAGRLAYRVLVGEGVVRSQLWVEYEVLGAHINVVGRSSDLLFALALITAKWPKDTGYSVVAATGVLDGEGAVHGVDGTAQKIAAALRDLEANTRAVVFYPAADAATIDNWRGTADPPPHVELVAVAHLEEALAHLNYHLDKVYLRNPFRGLEHFEYQHHSIFFGRDREVREVLEQLLRRESAGAPGLAVEGASGSGKSSFLLAGVLPALVELRIESDVLRAAISHTPVSSAVGRAVWRPRLPAADDSAIAASILECWQALPEWQIGGSAAAPSTLEDLAGWRAAAWNPALRFVWVIDQFEELFTQGWGDALIDTFGRFLVQLQGQGVWTLASIRADALSQLKEHAGLRQVFGANEGQYYLEALTGTALDAVINLPARAADLSFGRGPDGKSLDQTLREDAYQEKGRLPQLEFTLNELYQRRSGNELTYAAYHEMGGIAGSIATMTAAVLNADGEESSRSAPRLFRSLVSVDDSGRATRRYAPLADVTGDAAQGRLLSRLLEARLCVTDQRDGQAVVAFAHDTLLQTLPALIDWLKEEAGLLQTRDLAQRETRLWEQRDHADSWLAPADKVAAFRTLQDAGIVLPDSVRSFIERSDRRVRRARHIKQAAVGVIGLLGVSLLIASIAFGLQQRRAAEAREMAARRGEFLERLLNSADPRLGGRDVTVAQLLDTAVPQIEPLVAQEPRVAASMLGLVAETNRGLGRYPAGLEANARELALLRANGGGALELSEALSLRGELLISSGRSREAVAPLEEAMHLAERQPGASKQLGAALDDLGAALEDSGNDPQAESMYQRAVDVYRHAGPGFAASVAFPLANLGVLRYNQGRYEESAVFIREALAIDRKYLPRDHPDLLGAEYNYAATLEHSHRASEAEPIFRELLESYRRVLGPDHVDTLLAQQGLAHNLLKQRRYAEAAATALPAAEGLSRVAGDSHEWTQVAWGVYGVAACLAGQGDAGLKALRRVAARQGQSADANNWRVQMTDVQIGTCMVALRRYAEAEPLLLKSIALLETQRGANFDHTQTGYRAMRDLYAGLGRPAEAAKWQAKLLPD